MLRALCGSRFGVWGLGVLSLIVDQATMTVESYPLGLEKKNSLTRMQGTVYFELNDPKGSHRPTKSPETRGLLGPCSGPSVKKDKGLFSGLPLEIQNQTTMSQSQTAH